MKLFIFVLIILCNLISFFLFAWDKRRAVKQRMRIPEKTLLFSAFLGGFGAFLAMEIFRHKTKKPLFYISVPLFCFLQLIGFGALLYFI